jgi:hypothetical protein
MLQKLGLLMLLVFTAVGCGGVESVAGGTRGTLLADGAPLSEIQITVHHVDGSTTQPVGFGVTAFELFANGAQGPLWLEPGEYRCTLESVGAPLQIRQEYTQPETTPLKVSWSQIDQSLNLEIPTPPMLK